MHVLMLGGSPHHPGGIEAFCERSKAALERRGDWRIAHLPTRTAYLTLRRLPWLLRGLADLTAYRFKRPDCIWLQYGNLPDLAYLVVAKLLGCTVMVTPHLGKNWRSQSNPSLRRLSDWLLGFADRLALISATQELEINLPVDVPRSQIRNFLSDRLLSSTLPSAGGGPLQMQIVHSGRLSEGKGTFMLIDLCASLREAGVPFSAKITGGADPGTLQQLHQKIADNGLEDCISVLGRVPEDQLIEQLQRSDVLVHLSRVDSYPLIVLEAMACAIFPVCLELAGARDMVETFDGCVVSEQAPVQEATAFLATRDLDELRRRGAASALEVRAEYSWDRCATALSDALHASVRPRAARLAPVC